MNKNRQATGTFDKLLDLSIHGSALLIFLSWLVVCTEVGSRLFFNRPLVWVVEAAEYMTLYCLFLGAAWVMREEEHIQVDIFISILNTKNRTLLMILSSILGSAVCIILTFYGTTITWTHYQEDLRTFTAMEIPKWPFLLAVPLGSLLLLVQFVRRLFDSIMKLKASDEHREKA